MNPFDNCNINTTTTSDKPIYIWVEQSGRKHNTYVSDWDIDDALIKEHLKTIKKKNGCNGSVKEIEINENSIKRVMQLQGDHAEYVKKFITNTGIDESRIYIKG
jgi:translation initiation factor 1 (eIF-1/SUI1)